MRRSTHGQALVAETVVFVETSSKCARARTWLRQQVDPVGGWQRAGRTRRAGALMALPVACLLLMFPAGGTGVLVASAFKGWLAYSAVRVVRPHQHRHWTKARTASGALLVMGLAGVLAPALACFPAGARAGAAACLLLALSSSSWALASYLARRSRR